MRVCTVVLLKVFCPGRADMAAAHVWFDGLVWQVQPGSTAAASERIWLVWEILFGWWACGTGRSARLFH